MNYFIQILYNIYLFLKKIIFLNIFFNEEKLFIDKPDLETLNKNDLKAEKLINEHDVSFDLQSFNNEFKDEKLINEFLSVDRIDDKDNVLFDLQSLNNEFKDEKLMKEFISRDDKHNSKYNSLFDLDSLNNDLIIFNDSINNLSSSNIFLDEYFTPEKNLQKSKKIKSFLKYNLNFLKKRLFKK